MTFRKEIFIQRALDVDFDALNVPNLTGVMLWHDELMPEVVERFRSLGLNVGVVLNATSDVDACPAIGVAMDSLDAALALEPDTVWIDHIRFPGTWESNGIDYIETHFECPKCRMHDKIDIIRSLAESIRTHVAGRAELGYFAVPFDIEHSRGIALSGQQHTVLAPFFDVISPMLYNHMLGRPNAYIESYVRQLSAQVAKPVMPILQSKSMPDDLEDTITFADLLESAILAAREPSSGVAWFCWEHVVAQGKQKALARCTTIAGR